MICIFDTLEKATDRVISEIVGPTKRPVELITITCVLAAPPLGEVKLI